MSNKDKFQIKAGSGAHCCATDEIGYFEMRDLTKDKPYHDPYQSMMIGTGDSPEDAAKKLLEDIVQKIQGEGWGYTGTAVRYFWFVKPRDWKGDYNAQYDAEPLRQEVMKYPGVIKLGEYRNANTGNMVDGYMITIEIDEQHATEEEEYD